MRLFARTLIVVIMLGWATHPAAAQTTGKILVTTKLAYGVELLVPLDFQCGRTVDLYAVSPSEDIVDGIATNIWRLLSPPPNWFPYTVGESWTNCSTWETMNIRVFVAPMKSRMLVVQRSRITDRDAVLTAKAEASWEGQFQLKSSEFSSRPSEALARYLKIFWQEERKGVDWSKDAGFNALSYREQEVLRRQAGTPHKVSEAMRVADMMPLLGPAGVDLVPPKPGSPAPTVVANAGGDTGPVPPELTGAPAQHRDAVAASYHGKAFNFTAESLLFMGGLASHLMRECGLPRDMGDRISLALFVKAAEDRAMLGADYSNRNLGEAMGKAAVGGAVFVAGVQFAKSLNCTGTAAAQLASGLTKTVKANETGTDGGRPRFVTSCAPHFSETRCECVAKLGRAVIPNIYQMEYRRDIIVRIIEGSPVVALQMAAICQISNY